MPDVVNMLREEDTRDLAIIRDALPDRNLQPRSPRNSRIRGEERGAP